MAEDLKSMALDYHRFPKPGKLEITPTKKMANQRDLALAYSPGVADACMLIADDPSEAANMTARANLVGVISNGTAVLGLGNIGALASKPVMEGKAVLFKKFAGVDVFDIEVDETDPDKMVDIVRGLEPTFGGINLEDIKAPECFIIEQKCRETMNIPVFHDDQHGTAICVAAAIYNALRLVEKNIEDVKIVVSGAGAAAQACTMQILSLGAQLDNIRLCDRKGVIYQGRDGVDQFKSRFAADTDDRTLDDAINEADVFLGVSGPGTLTGDMVKKMAKDPIVLALANPVPEILPEEAHAARPDVIMATGRSDYPNQVNNVLCFPFIFRGALDCGATTINEEMKIATVKAIADLALAEPSEVVANAYQGEKLTYGREYLIPKPFDPRLIVHIAPAVAQAAMDTGVATRPITDMDAYVKKLEQFIYESGQAMRPIFERAKESPKRVIYAEGDDPRVLRAAQIVIEDGYAAPILVGDKELIAARVKDFGLGDLLDRVTIVDPYALSNDEVASLTAALHAKLGRNGVSPSTAERMIKNDTTVLAAMLLETGAGDAMLCGAVGRFSHHLRHVYDVLGLAPGVARYSAVQMVLTQHDTIFITDSHANLDPTADQLAAIVPQAAQVVERFGLTPKIAMCSHANFGSENDASARKMRQAAALIKAQHPDLEIDGEMQVDAALNENVRKRLMPESSLSGRANLLVMPDIDAANISFNLVKQVTQGLSVGPILTGLAKPAHVVATAISTRGLVNMTAMAVVDAQDSQ